ncbi:TPA: alkene reductase [Legionella pneumophila]|nr:alkene reductase [Legionella pneumophila]HAT8330733.1 alkene reductase [Legionella pneumophila]
MTCRRFIMVNSDLILSPYQLNEKITLKNRVIMAPMTRNMANDDFSPTRQMADYYARRADAGLIITEGTIISPDGQGYSNAPGIFTQTHIDGWKMVTDAVHERGGKIFLQIWHVGRVSHPIFLHGNLPISASETMMTGKVRRADDLYYGKSRAATLEEINELIQNYALAARRAMIAGFDGIEIHGANGYLIDQFLHYYTNQRHDQYGQYPENMGRFALEVVKACINEIGEQSVGLRLSPGAYLNEIVGDERDAMVFRYVLEELNHYGIAYVHTGNFDDGIQFKELGFKTMTEFMRAHFKGTLIASGSYTLHQARKDIQNKKYDLIALGRPFIANPDLMNRIKWNADFLPYENRMLDTLF